MVVDIEVLSMAVLLVSTAGLRRQSAMDEAGSVVTCFWRSSAQTESGSAKSRGSLLKALAGLRRAEPCVRSTLAVP